MAAMNDLEYNRLEFSDTSKPIVPEKVKQGMKKIQGMLTKKQDTNGNKNNNHVRFMTAQFLRYGLPSLLIVLLIMSIISKLQNNRVTLFPSPEPLIPPSPNPAKGLSYAKALSDHASTDRVILLSLTDSGFMDMTLNFFYTSIFKYSIRNYLFISTDPKACVILQDHDIACYVYKDNVRHVDKATEYGSEKFKQKMNIRTKMILEALQLGFHVVHSDVDVVFMRDPMGDLANQCPGRCDVAVMWDHVVYNAGFLYAKAHTNSINLYKKMMDIAKNEPKLDDQEGLNNAIQSLLKGKQLQLSVLDKQMYVNGYKFFEEGKRMFAWDNPCKECMVLHNNWIVSKAAKIYRFKEHNMWLQDDHHYYSDPDRMYLTYNNTYETDGISDSEILNLEKNALRNALALGKILKRTVILPSFHCSSKSKLPRDCPLNALFRISEFDKAFGDSYREHSFLTNPLVPGATVQSSSPSVHVIYSQKDTPKAYPDHLSSPVYVIHQPADQEKGATQQEVVHWLGSIRHRVLRLHSLYHAFQEFINDSVNEDFNKKIRQGLKPASYRQYN